MTFTRRSMLAGTVTAAVAAGVSAAGTASAAPPRATEATGGYLVGAGIADVTGAVAGQGMMGYSELDQVATGLLMRTWARAYIVVDQATGDRVAFVSADIACLFQSVHLAVMQRLAQRFGALYTERNVNLNATHNHNSCGGTAREYAYSLAAYGFQNNSHQAEVDGIVAALVAAHDNLAPGTLSLGHGELHDAVGQPLPGRVRTQSGRGQVGVPERHRSDGHGAAVAAGREGHRRDHLVRDARHLPDRCQHADLGG